MGIGVSKPVQQTDIQLRGCTTFCFQRLFMRIQDSLFVCSKFLSSVRFQVSDTLQIQSVTPILWMKSYYVRIEKRHKKRQPLPVSVLAYFSNLTISLGLQSNILQRRSSVYMVILLLCFRLLMVLGLILYFSISA